MPLIFLEQPAISDPLYPFTETRSILDIRIGILTIREKWELLLKKKLNSEADKQTGVRIPANVIPTAELARVIISGKFKESDAVSDSIKRIEHPWHIFEFNDECLRQDFELLTRNKISHIIPESVQVVRSTRIFIEENARLSHCTLNAENGPIYIGKNAEVMEGAFIRGPFALGEGS